MYNVLVTSKSFGTGLGPDHHKQLFQKLLNDSEVNVLFGDGTHMTAKNILEINDERPLSAILAFSSSDEINETVLTGCKDLKVVSRHGVGVDNIDLVVAERLGIKIMTTRDTAVYNAVAEMTIGLMLALSRNIVKTHVALSTCVWDRLKSPGIYGKTIGIIGMGNIGKTVAYMAKQGFDMLVMGYDPYIEAHQFPDFVNRRTSLDALLAHSDFVTLHCDANASNFNMISEKELNKMKPTAYLINTARGSLVNSADLVTSLQDGTIAGAACDVYKEEPVVETSDKLLYYAFSKNANIVLTPHIASNTYGAVHCMDQLAVENILQVLKGDL